ncbi:peptidoglycan-binding protein [bacterium]|nr:peptidoglycan-binding protein [bacterium]
MDKKLKFNIPSKNQWRQLFRTFLKKEKIVFRLSLTAIVASLFYLSADFYLKHTEIKPKKGGVYKEGLVGQPRLINPVYADAFDVDRDLTEVIFSGLMKYDENLNLVPDLAKSYKIEEEGKIFDFYLKEGVRWSDGKPFTADDVIFTIEIIKNPEYRSPARANWIGVETEKISKYAVRFKLPNCSSIFLDRTTQKIIPKHIWEKVPPENFPLSIFNLKPVGTGPYKFVDLKQNEKGYIESVTLEINPYYYGEKPYIPKIVFFFFSSEDELLKAAEQNAIDGFSLSSSEANKKVNGKYEQYFLNLPRYFAVFLNPKKSKFLKDKEIRQALNYGTDKKEIIEKVLDNKGEIVNSPILPNFYGFNPPLITYPFDPETANEILDEKGLEKNNQGIREKKAEIFNFSKNLSIGDKGGEVKKLQECLSQYNDIYPQGEITGYFGNKTKEAVKIFQKKYVEGVKGSGFVGKKTRAKLNELCKEKQETTLFKIDLTTVDQPELEKTAEILKKQWKKIGVKVEIKIVDSTFIEREIIKPREYEALLFGEILSKTPDPYPFWHSSQRIDPGLNLSYYENKEVDKVLRGNRECLDEEKRRNYLEKFQDLLSEDAPAVFLYNPNFIYWVSEEIKGVNLRKAVNPSYRLGNIEKWYIKTKRVWR